MKFRDLPPLPNEGAHKLGEIWDNITYYLKAVVPVAERANVRMALHPNDPPAPTSRGSEQIMGAVDGWKHLISIVNSPSNGITFDCGVTREMGGDPVEVARYFGSRDRINHVHFRNVKVIKPYERYSEVWIDEGDNNMFAVMPRIGLETSTSCRFTRNIPAGSITMPIAPASIRNIQAVAAIQQSPITSATPGQCCKL